MKNILKVLAGIALIAIIVGVIVLSTNSSFLKGQLSLQPSTNVSHDNITTPGCLSLRVKTIPSPLPAEKSATVIIESDPSDWQGEVRISASSGTFSDSLGNIGSSIETTEKILSFSGGAANTNITAQALEYQHCLDSVKIIENKTTQCESISVSTEPQNFPPNESATISIQTVPNEWSGLFLVKAQTGKFQLTSADPSVLGENTNTFITSLRKIIYSGGNKDDTIEISALGEKNEKCKISLTIGASL